MMFIYTLNQLRKRLNGRSGLIRNLILAKQRLKYRFASFKLELLFRNEWGADIGFHDLNTETIIFHHGKSGSNFRLLYSEI